MAPVATNRRTVKLAKGRPVRPGVPDEAVANKVAAATAPMLLRLLRLPRFLVPILALALLFTGLALGGVAGLLILWFLAGILGWFLIAFWPVTPTSGRVLRTLVVAAVAVAGLFNL
jgi:hypothetical protein